MEENNKKNEEPENIDPPELKIPKASTQLEQINKITKKKREERKSQKAQINIKRQQQNITEKEDSPRVGYLIIDELLGSIHSELRYQRVVLDNLSITFSSLRTMVNTESEQSQALEEKMKSEISHVNTEMKQDQTELKNMKGNYEKLQTKLDTTKKKRSKK